jgi:hypothetical protein
MSLAGIGVILRRQRNSPPVLVETARVTHPPFIDLAEAMGQPGKLPDGMV